MRTLRGISALALAAALFAACTSSAPATPSPTSPATPLPSTAPTAPPSVASVAPSVAPSPTESPNACAAAVLPTKTVGKLVIGSDNPAYPPYFAESSPNPTPWEFGDPTNGQGFESAVAYAVAKDLGYTKDQVSWVATPFNNAIQPGPKAFDIYFQEVSFSPDRAQAVDLTDGYYDVAQAVVAVKGSKIADVTTISGLAGFQFGAQVGTTSFALIGSVIKPAKEAKVYDTNDAALAALKNGQIDGLVTDLPTAFFMSDPNAGQMKNGVIVGQFPPTSDAEHFSIVLDHGSSITGCVNAALAHVKASGELAQITQTWLADKANAPVFQP
jgi:polar amino acid transport system substrate-binding protein